LRWRCRGQGWRAHLRWRCRGQGCQQQRVLCVDTGSAATAVLLFETGHRRPSHRQGVRRMEPRRWPAERGAPIGRGCRNLIWLTRGAHRTLSHPEGSTIHNHGTHARCNNDTDPCCHLQGLERICRRRHQWICTSLQHVHGISTSKPLMVLSATFARHPQKIVQRVSSEVPKPA